MLLVGHHYKVGVESCEQVFGCLLSVSESPESISCFARSTASHG